MTQAAETTEDATEVKETEAKRTWTLSYSVSSQGASPLQDPLKTEDNEVEPIESLPAAITAEEVVASAEPVPQIEVAEVVPETEAVDVSEVVEVAEAAEVATKIEADAVPETTENVAEVAAEPVAAEVAAELVVDEPEVAETAKAEETVTAASQDVEVSPCYSGHS